MATLTMIEPQPSDKPEKAPGPRGSHDLSSLTTESPNAASQGLDTKSALEIARIINHEDAKVAAAVKRRCRRSPSSSTPWLARCGMADA